MKQLYLSLGLCILFSFFLTGNSWSQCAQLGATYATYESRCAATGAIKVHVTGGSGNYKFKTTGPVNTNFTSSDSITGLSAGSYTLIINDVGTNCTITKPLVIVPGTYQDPRFSLTKIDVSCNNGNNGSILVDNNTFGRAPFEYSIVAPSTMGIGTTNSSGIFTNLAAGNYSVMMTDSCGGIQTRQISILNYNWWIDSYQFNKTGCDDASGFIKVIDSRGNISTVGGLPGFMYGVVRATGDTVWSSSPNLSFALLGHTNFQVIAKDLCGNIKKANSALSLVPVVAASINASNYTCNTFTASLTVDSNFFSPQFCISDNHSALLTCNSTGVFPGLPYGNYCITVHDACTDTTVSRCITVNAPPIAASNTVAISNKVCTGFTASVTGQVGLTTATYCLYDAADHLVACNSTGIFSGLTYQAYCITIQDGCRDTMLRRCFTALPPLPVIPAVINPYYINCVNFGIVVPGDSLTAPQYCLYDSAGALLMCNTTGVFDSIPLGNYCVTVHDSCYDSTITRCLSVIFPVIYNDIVLLASHKNCAGFTLVASSHNLTAPLYCLYSSDDVLLLCNNSGEFDNLPYGDYCIKASVACPDTMLISCISVGRDIPSIAAPIQIANLTCGSFTATVSGQTNLSAPGYCLFSDAGLLLGCNATGIFSNIPYGTYCIKITDACYDTTITTCFSQAPIRVTLSANAGKSCSYGWAQFTLNMGSNSGFLPVNIRIYNPDGSLFLQQSSASNVVLIDSIPGIGNAENYKIVVTDNCGNKDSLLLSSPASIFTHRAVVVPKCPGATWANGSGNIVETVITNMGSLSVKIIKKNGVALFPSITANTVVAGVYSFIDLGPGTYIISCAENICAKKLYDTVVISTYQYPNLDRSSAYQCDVNGFSISAVAANGVGPFSYEIIGSQPASPVITSVPQTSPVFNINNGSNYSLIRLRALDACGNATLGDASILPLAINGAISSSNCLLQPTTLEVDSFFNSTYKWYKKQDALSDDSVLIGNGTSYFIPAVQPSDTGLYVCYVSVNSGCINRVFSFHVGGSCWIVLPVSLGELKGQEINHTNILSWKFSAQERPATFYIERKHDRGNFDIIGSVASGAASERSHQYAFHDQRPPHGDNYYRLRVVTGESTYRFSNIVMLRNDQVELPYNIYPNPVKEKLFINFTSGHTGNYQVTLFNPLGQPIRTLTVTHRGAQIVQIPRGLQQQKGIYILRIDQLDTGETFQEKILFL